jgi:hypothetical protein
MSDWYKKHWFHRNCLRTHPFYLNINQIQIFSFLLKVPRQSEEGKARNICMKFESIFIEIVSIMKLSYFFIDKCTCASASHFHSLYFAFCLPYSFWLGDMVCLYEFLCLFCIQIIPSVWTTNEYPFEGWLSSFCWPYRKPLQSIVYVFFYPPFARWFDVGVFRASFAKAGRKFHMWNNKYNLNKQTLSYPLMRKKTSRGIHPFSSFWIFHHSFIHFCWIHSSKVYLVIFFWF